MGISQLVWPNILRKVEINVISIHEFRALPQISAMVMSFVGDYVSKKRTQRKWQIIVVILSYLHALVCHLRQHWFIMLDDGASDIPRPVLWHCSYSLDPERLANLRSRSYFMKR
jgi:hypothetical protein